MLYIESIGLRRPRRTSDDLRRAIARVRRFWQAAEKRGDNIWVLAPPVLPANSVSVIRRINRRLLGLALSRAMRKLEMKREILWTFNPITAEVMELDGWPLVVYYSVDNIAAQPGMVTDAIIDAEPELIGKADLVFATTQEIADHLQVIGANQVHIFGNVVDYDHFSKTSKSTPRDLAEIPYPRLGFVGAISNYKVDFELLGKIAAAVPEWQIVLLGKVGIGEPETSLELLENINNIHIIGAKPYAQLPDYLHGFDVGLLPCPINDYTKSMYPMKFFEYMACGLPVVATDIPAVRPWGSLIRIAHSHEEFIDGIAASLLEVDSQSREKRMAAAQENTYGSRTASMLKLIDERLAQKVRNDA